MASSIKFLTASLDCAFPPRSLFTGSSKKTFPPPLTVTLRSIVCAWQHYCHLTRDSSNQATISLNCLWCFLSLAKWMVQFRLSSVQTQRQTPQRIIVSLSWSHHPGILAILTSSYMYWPTGAYPQAPRCGRKMVVGVPDWEKRFTSYQQTTEILRQ